MRRALLSESRGRTTVPHPMLLDSFTSQFSPATFATALAATAAVRIYERRPRGFLNPSIRLLVQKSQVPGGGLGVYVEDTLPAGTQLGAYPGRLLYMAEYTRKLAVHPHASTYCWKLQDDNGVLDPTDAQGNLYDAVPLIEGVELGAPWAVPTTLARINEPPPRGDVNVETLEEGDTLTFFLRRDCRAGEELYLDYGMDYDRSMYGGAG